MGSVLPSNDWLNGSFSLSCGYQGGNNPAVASTTAELQPDKVYTFNYGTSGVDSAQVAIGVPQGYEVWINGLPQPIMGLTGASGFIQVMIASPSAMSGRAGVASSITSGQVRWQVALGSLLSGEIGRRPDDRRSGHGNLLERGLEGSDPVCGALLGNRPLL